MVDNSLNASVFFPAQPHWTAQDLADAVPLRLHRLFAFDAGDAVLAPTANSATRAPPLQRGDYVPHATPTFFRIR